MLIEDDSPSPNLAICVLTRLREAGLIRALDGIAKQLVPSPEFSRIRVIVVDNDPYGSGKPVCDRLRPSYPWPLDYILEPRVGIPYARNRALELAKTSDDLMAFLDDDEVPSETWIAELLRVRRAYSADVVFGPVLPYFPDPVPPWIERGNFFGRETHLTGTICAIGATNNVLISIRMLKQSGIRFDETNPFIGGSDTVFFWFVNRAGYRMIWADKALVTEWIPRYRTNLKWLAMRRFRNGDTEFYDPDIRIKHRLRAAFIGILRVLFGAICAVFFFPFGRHLFAKAVCWASYGLGLLYGATGRYFQEYRSVRRV